MGDAATQPDSYDAWVHKWMGTDPRKSSKGDSQDPPANADSTGGGATGMVATGAGQIIYKAAMASKITPILNIIAGDYEKALDQQATLIGDISKLEGFEAKYKDYSESDLKSEVAQNTDKGLKDDASRVRDTERNTKGFMIVVNKLIRDIPKAQKEIELAENDQKVAEIGKEVAKLKKAQESMKSMLDLGGQIVHLATDITNPVGWVDMAITLGKYIVDEKFEHEIGPLEEQASKIVDSNIAEHIKLAKQVFAEAKSDFQSWQSFLESAKHDLAEEVTERDDDYDKQNDKKKKGTVRLNEMKDAATLAKSVHDLVSDTVGVAHSVRSLLQQLEAGNMSAWVANPAVTHKTIASMMTTTQALYKELEPKVNWATGLEKRFAAFYKAAGTAMADKKL